MLDYYQELLESFDKLKQRKLKLNERLGYKNISTKVPKIGDKVHAESFRLFGVGKPEDFVKARPPANVPMGPPVPGKLSLDPATGNYMIVDVEGKPQVIFSRNGRPDIIGWRRWATALAELLFAQDNPMGQASPAPGDPNADPNAGVEGMPPAQPDAGTVGSIQTFDDIPTTPLQAKLNRGKASIISVIENSPNFFEGDPSKVQWMASGIDGRYGNLRRRLFNAKHSIEYRLSNAYGLKNINGVLVPVEFETDDKERAVDIVVNFFSKIQKLANTPDEFSAEDMDWVHSHIVRDKDGVWFKDDHTLPYGVLFAWREGRQEQHSNLWDNLVESYNRNLQQVMEDREEPEFTIIETQPLRMPNYSGMAGESHYLIGKVAEEIRPGIMDFINGNAPAGIQKISQTLLPRVSGIEKKFQFLAYFQLDEMAGGEQVAEVLKDVDEIKKIFRKSFMPASTAVDTVRDVLIAGVKMEKNALLLRRPIEVEFLGNVTRKGFKADTKERYTSEIEAADALRRTGVPEHKIPDFIMPGGVIGESIKTRIYANGKIKTGESSIEEASKVIIDDAPEYKTLRNKVRETLQVNPNHYEEISEAERQLAKDRETIRSACTNMNVRGMNRAEVRAHIDGVIKSFILGNAVYGDLLDFAELDKLLDSASARNRLASSIIRAKELQTILRNAENDPREMVNGEYTEKARKARVYRSLLAMKACAVGCSFNDVLLNVRAYEDLSSYITSQNDIHYNLWKDYINGVAKVKLAGKNTLWIGYQAPNGDFDNKMKVSLERQLDGQSTKVVYRTYITPEYMKEVAYVPVVTESTDKFIEEYLNNQRLLLERLFNKKVRVGKH